MANIIGKESKDATSNGSFRGEEDVKGSHGSRDTSSILLSSAADSEVIRRYGHLYEGTQTFPTADKAAFKRRYIARRTLAELTICPEGFEFQHQLEDQPFQAVILLTPPHLVALCNNNGQWSRRSRNEALDGPQPYTQEWYHIYLRNNRLPNWFFSAGHLDLLTNTVEAQMLGVVDTEIPPGRAIPSTYLALRYTTPPQFPEFIGTTHDQPHVYSLREDEQLCLARQYPATNMLAADRRVLIMPGSYVVIHHDPLSTDHPTIDRSQLRWSSSAASRASYILSRPDNVSLADLLSSNAGTRSGLAATKTSNGAFVNPTEHMPGFGAWEWLDAGVDRPAAEALGWKQPADVAFAVAHGHLRAGRQPYDAPSIVWQPDSRYFNPAEEPAEPGLWAFASIEAREKAREDLGGQDAYGLADSPNPSAYEIWQIRQYYTNLASNDSGSQHDPTAEIDLVWILAGAEEASGENLVHSEVAGEQEEQTNSSSQVPAPIPVGQDAGHGHDRTTGLVHEPLNNGENDQTASDGRGEYNTRIVNGKKITLDRARAHPVNGSVPAQVHRLWTYTKGGKWQRYPETGGKINWADKASVEKLNKWRQQSEKRNEWDPKRTVAREHYSDEQRAWVFAFIAGNNGGRPAQGSAALCQGFNAKFNSQRQEKAINALVDRLMKEYKANNGQLKTKEEKPSKRRKTAPTQTREDTTETMGDANTPTVEDQANVDGDAARESGHSDIEVVY